MVRGQRGAGVAPEARGRRGRRSRAFGLEGSPPKRPAGSVFLHDLIVTCPTSDVSPLLCNMGPAFRRYGTSLAAVEAVSSEGRVAILDIDVQGAEQVGGVDGWLAGATGDWVGWWLGGSTGGWLHMRVGGLVGGWARGWVGTPLLALGCFQRAC
jgi:hypothetical protein